MLSVSYNDISMTRGDTVVLNLSVIDYVINKNDTVVLTIKKSINDAEYLVQKTLDDETLQFVFEPDDTNELDYGTYKYDVQVTTEQGEIYTIITPHNFNLGGEVTW